MIREDWFPTSIWYGYLDFNTENIKNLCLEQRKIDPEGRKISNIGGWQSQDNINLKKEFKSFFDSINSKLEYIHKDIGPSFKTKITNAWININGPYDYNNKHVHAWSTLSGCVYIDTDNESGKIVFTNPTNQDLYPFHLDSENKNSRYFSAVDYKPKNNKIIIFPSWIEHEVLPSRNTKTERISISFNSLQVN
jgi:uncharacterized protein (TIGR02466 family)